MIKIAPAALKNLLGLIKPKAVRVPLHGDRNPERLAALWAQAHGMNAAGFRQPGIKRGITKPRAQPSLLERRLGVTGKPERKDQPKADEKEAEARGLAQAVDKTRRKDHRARQAMINGMSNWQRSQWARADYPGAKFGESMNQLERFANLQRRSACGQINGAKRSSS